MTGRALTSQKVELAIGESVRRRKVVVAVISGDVGGGYIANQRPMLFSGPQSQAVPRMAAAAANGVGPLLRSSLLGLATSWRPAALPLRCVALPGCRRRSSWAIARPPACSWVISNMGWIGLG